MNKTKIEWVKNPDGSQGYTWNPITGCLNGCSYCYARKLANGRLKKLYLSNNRYSCSEIEMPSRRNTDPFYPRFWPEKIRDIKPPRKYAEFSSTVRNSLILQKAKGIFCCDMSDLFGIGIPESWTRQVLNTIEMAWHHRFYLLTKQPQNLARFSPFPGNCWVGVSATDEAQFNRSMHYLSGVTTSVKYVSFEPLLEPIYFTKWSLNQINWVIIGAQTKPYNPPKIEWVKEIVESADRAGVPVFLKNNLNQLFKGMKTQELDDMGFLMQSPECPSGLVLRQEMKND